MVAVDPSVIPLGSTVWVQGLGTFLATDTGSLVRGTHLDVFTLSYADALAWGVQERAVQVFGARVILAVACTRRRPPPISEGRAHAYGLDVGVLGPLGLERRRLVAHGRTRGSAVRQTSA